MRTAYPYLLRMQYILRDKHGEGNPPTIPDHIRMEIARCLLPDIIAFCESEEGKREFEEWKKKQLQEDMLDNSTLEQIADKVDAKIDNRIINPFE